MREEGEPLELYDGPPTQQGGAPSGLASTGILLPNDPTVTAPWSSYFDTAERKYFYVNSSTNTAQYEHPFPPIFSGSDTVVRDITVAFLPSGWLKLQSKTLNIPYYLHTPSLETRWVHANPPPDPSALAQAVDATLNSTYKKYIDPTTTRPFFINSTTLEGQWNFPDSAFNVGPSTAQQASSALAQAISGAQASSAVAQGASSAVAQAISGAQQSSAVAQQASSAIAQSISGAQQSSAVAQADSSAQQQTASSSYQQRDSSAQQQTVSSAVKQSVSSAQYEAASSALAQKASSAIAQTVSSALAYTASSAQQQTASSANAENDLASYMNDKDAIKSTLVPIQTETNALIRAVYSPAGGVTMATLSQLQNNITTVVDQQNILHTTANNIFRFHDYYQDPALQTLIPDTKLTSMGLKKVFDTLRNKYIVLDSRGAIVSNPVNPATRSYTTFVLRGGKRAPRHSRRTYRAVLK